MIVQAGFDCDTDAVSGFAKTAPAFSTDAVYDKCARSCLHYALPDVRNLPQETPFLCTPG
jgi:hypothetical protein